MHTTPIQIRFNDIDQMGHINNAVYLEFFDLAKEHFFAEAKVDLYHQDFTIMIVHIDVDFRRQVHFNDHIAVTSKISRFGNKSLEFEQQVVLVDENQSPLVEQQPMATCRTVMSGYLRSTAHSAPIPDDVKQKLSFVN